MSQIAPSPRKPVEATPRKAVSQRERLDLFVEQRGRCAACELKCVLPDMHLDHRIPLALGGAHERTNWQLLCVPCHQTKTSQDRKDIAKAIRREAKDQGRFPEPVRKLRGPGFPKSRNKAFEESAR